jgi:hypothetical protein
MDSGQAREACGISPIIGKACSMIIGFVVLVALDPGDAPSDGG